MLKPELTQEAFATRSYWFVPWVIEPAIDPRVPAAEL